MAQVKTLQEANRFLAGFLSRFNRRFAVSPAQLDCSYCRVPSPFKGEEIFCFKYHRTVGADHVVAFADPRFQIHPCHGRQSYYRARVEMRERMDGTLAIFYQGKCLATQSTPPEAPLLRVQKKRPPRGPKPDGQLPFAPKEGKKPSHEKTSLRLTGHLLRKRKKSLRKRT